MSNYFTISFSIKSCITELCTESVTEKPARTKFKIFHTYICKANDLGTTETIKVMTHQLSNSISVLQIYFSRYIWFSFICFSKCHKIGGQVAIDYTKKRNGRNIYKYKNIEEGYEVPVSLYLVFCYKK